MDWLSQPRYPIYIVSKGRYETRLTAKAFEKMGVNYHIVVEPQEQAAYAAVINPKKILALPFRNLGFGSIPARNWIWDHAEASGAARHWICDDNIRGFYRLNNNQKVPIESGVIFRVVEDLADRYENVALAGMQYDFFAPRKSRMSPVILNTRIYSCVAPDTPILCADLTWKQAGEIKPGEEIVAFDENRSLLKGRHDRGVRAYRTAVVHRNEPGEKFSYLVETDIGTPMIASAEHPWLAWRSLVRKRRWRNRPAGEQVKRAVSPYWIETKDLRVGDQVVYLANPWKSDETHDGGWISGMFDGEGTLGVRRMGQAGPRGGAHREGSRGSGVGIGIAQKPGPVLDRLREALRQRGYALGTRDLKPSKSGVSGVSINGGFPEMLRFAGEFRPTRIIRRATEMWEGKLLWGDSTYRLATITSIESVGQQPVAEITTSTGTFITNGYLTHNCILIKNDLPYRWRGRYNEDTDLSLCALKDGWCTILVCAFLAKKITTMKMKGGNTDELYTGVEAMAKAWDAHTAECEQCRRCHDGYQVPHDRQLVPCETGLAMLATDGRWRMADALRAQHPDVTTIERRWARWQHVVDYRPFERNTLRLKPGVVIPEHPVDYGLIYTGAPL